MSAGEQRIEFLNKRGDKLVGTLVLPATSTTTSSTSSSGSGSKPTPTVILAHGYMSSRNSELLIRIATALAREGLASVRFDFSGNGESEGRFRYGCYR